MQDVTEILSSTTEVLGSYQINLSNGIMPNFGRIRFFSQKIEIDDTVNNPGKTIVIPFVSINKISTKNFLFLNTQIVIHFVDNGNIRTISFASGDQMSINVYKTLYLYETILILKNSGRVDMTLLNKTCLEDIIPPWIMIGGSVLGAFAFPTVISFLIQNNILNISDIQLIIDMGKPFMLLPMLVGSCIVGLPIGIYFSQKVNKKIILIESENGQF